MIDIAVPYRKGGSKWDENEVRYMLRSIEKNFKEEHRIWFIGDVPDFAQGVRHIPFTKERQKPFPKTFEATYKTNLIIVHPEITELYLMMHDDMLILKPTKLRDLEHWNYMAFDGGEKRLRQLAANTGMSHYKVKVQTIDALRSKGRCTQLADTVEEKRRARGDYFYDTETHLPRLFEKQKMIMVYRTFKPIMNRLLESSLYYNFHEPYRRRLLRKDDMVKAEFMGAGEAPYLGALSDTREQVMEGLEGKRFCNYNDMGLTPALKEVIAELFPEKCKYEV